MTQAEHLNGDRNALLREQLNQLDQEVHAGQTHFGRCERVQQMNRFLDELAVILPLRVVLLQFGLVLQIPAQRGQKTRQDAQDVDDLVGNVTGGC